MAVSIQVVNKSNAKALTTFIDVPHDLYQNDPNYVPMLYMEQEALLNPKKSPFFKHSDAEYFLAMRNGKCVGRIAAIRNDNHINYTGKRQGFFGFFDTIDDIEVANALIQAAEAWCRNHRLNTMIGPANFSTNETVGLLVDNFQVPPYIMMTYNAPYYVRLLEAAGCTKYTDLWCWELKTKEISTEFLERADAVEQRLIEKGYRIRELNMKKYKEEILRFLPIYNASWAENTGFVPMTEAEMHQIAKDLKAIVDPKLIHFAEKDGQCIGASIALPNINEVQIKLKRGRLLPIGFIKLLLGLKKIKTVRVIALGTVKEYRRLGIDVIFYAKLIREAQRRGISGGEASWILEKNDLMNRAIATMGGHHYRTYRLYQKSI